MIKSITLLGLLMQGLRSQFPSWFARSQLKNLLGLLKDKNVRVLAAINGAMDAAYQHVLPLEEVVDKVVAAQKSPVPEVRERALAFVARCLRHQAKPVASSQCSKVGDLALQGLNDGKMGVRKAASDMLVALGRRLGDADTAFSKLMSHVQADHTRAHTAITKTLAAPPASTEPPSPRRPRTADSRRSRPSSSTGRAATKRQGGARGARAASAGRAASGRGMKRTGSSLSRTSTGSASGGGGGGAGGGAGAASHNGLPADVDVGASEDHGGPLMTPEDAAEAVAGLGVNVAALTAKSAKWQDKRGVFDALRTKIDSMAPAQASAVAEAVVVFVAANSKQFSPGNRIIQKSVFDLMGAVATVATEPPVRAGVAGLLISPAILNLHDRKCQSGAVAMLRAFLAGPHARFVVHRAFKVATKAKHPDILVEFLNLLTAAIMERGAGGFNVHEVVGQLKSTSGLASVFQPQREASVKVAGALYHSLGEPVKRQLLANLADVFGVDRTRDCKSCQEALEKEFTTVGTTATASAAAAATASTAPAGDHSAANVPPHHPKKRLGRKRSSRSSTVSTDTATNATPAPGGAGSGSGAGAGAVAAHDAADGSDLTPWLTPELMDELNHTGHRQSWRHRQSALERVAELLKRHPVVAPTHSVQTLMDGVRARLGDTNQLLKVKATHLLAQLANAVGPRIIDLTRMVVPDLFMAMADHRKPMKKAVAGALDAILAPGGAHDYHRFMQHQSDFVEALEAHASGRADLLKWAMPYMQLVPSNCDASTVHHMASMVPVLLECMSDRTPAPRSAAQTMAVEVLRCAGLDAFERRLRDLKPAAQRTLQPMVKACIKKVRNGRGEDGADAAAAEGAAEAYAIDGAGESAAPAPALAPAPAPATSARASKSSTRRNRRPTTAPAAPAPAPAPAAGESAASGLLRGCEEVDKEKRAKKWHRAKWRLEEPRPEFVEHVKEECAAVASQALMDALFPRRSGGTKAFQLLTKCVHELPDEVIANLDTLLKWIVIRMFESQAAIVARVQDLLDALFVMLQSSDYALSDYEANILLPQLVDRLGNPKERFRKGFRSVIRSVCHVYPASKLVPHLMGGLRSKNTRTRQECVDDLVRLVQEGGWQVIGRRGMQRIGPLVGGDADLRNAALRLLEEVWLQHDRQAEPVFRLLGSSANSKAVGLIEERFKFYKGDATSRAAPASPHRGGGGGGARRSKGRGQQPSVNTAAAPAPTSPDDGPIAAAFRAAGLSGTGVAAGGAAGASPPSGFMFSMADVDYTGIDSPDKASQASPAASAAPTVVTSGAGGGAGASSGSGTGRLSRTFSLKVSEIASDMSRADSAGKAMFPAPNAPMSVRSVSYDSGDVPEFISSVISGLKDMISMFNAYVAQRGDGCGWPSFVLTVCDFFS